MRGGFNWHRIVFGDVICFSGAEVLVFSTQELVRLVRHRSRGSSVTMEIRLQGGWTGFDFR